MNLDYLKESQLGTLFLTPSLLLLLVIVGWPIIFSFYLSLHEVVVSGGDLSYRFVELGNYVRLLTDKHFQQALRQTIFYTTVCVSTVMIAGLALALVLHQSGLGAAIFKRLFLIPWALSYVVNALMWGWIFNGAWGVFNTLLFRLGLIKEYIVWLAQPREAMLVIIFVGVWKAIPFAALMFLAALKTVPLELEDAARVDGAGTWARFRHVMLPWIKPVAKVLLVIESLWALKTFDAIWVLTQGGPMERTMILNVLTYQLAFQFFRLGYASALAYVVAGLTLVLTLAYFKLLGGVED